MRRATPTWTPSPINQKRRRRRRQARLSCEVRALARPVEDLDEAAAANLRTRGGRRRPRGRGALRAGGELEEFLTSPRPLPRLRRTRR